MHFKAPYAPICYPRDDAHMLKWNALFSACSSNHLMTHLNTKSLFQSPMQNTSNPHARLNRKTKIMLVFAFLSNRWQHLPRRLRDLLAEYVGQHTLIITILSGVTDTHISIYINKWNRVWIQMMYHKVWMISHRNCTTNAGECELVGDDWQSKEQAL